MDEADVERNARCEYEVGVELCGATQSASLADLEQERLNSTTHSTIIIEPREPTRPQEPSAGGERGACSDARLAM
jgi:hypothetical protein